MSSKVTAFRKRAGMMRVVRAAGGGAMSDGDDVFVSVEPRYCVPLEE